MARFNRHHRPILSGTGILLICLNVGSPAIAAPIESLSLGDAKGWTATIFSKQGIGTAHAVAEGRVTRQEIAGWCENWQPGDKRCVAATLQGVNLGQIYRAEADCVDGTIQPTTGGRYTLAGVWDGRDVGGGRTKWRDGQGHIVGRDNASGGLGISQQWEVLCPGPLKVNLSPNQPSTPHAAAPRGLPFAVGDQLEAKFGATWIPAHVQAIHRVRTPRGIEIGYEVTLANGQRGIVPARMLRKPGGT